jgi:hypothetical protein
MLVTAMGWKLLNEGGGSSDEPLHDAADAGAANDSFYPLTLPLTSRLDPVRFRSP